MGILKFFKKRQFSRITVQLLLFCLIAVLLIGTTSTDYFDKEYKKSSVKAGISETEGISVNCTLYDYFSDGEILHDDISLSYQKSNYEMFKLKGYDDLSKTNTINPIPIGSFVDDYPPEDYIDNVDALLNETFGSYKAGLNSDIYKTYSTLASFSPTYNIYFYDTAMPGLVDETLEDGVLTQSYNGKRDKLPWFDEDFLDTKIPGTSSNFGKYYSDLQFPFRYSSEDGYYEFSSEVDTTRLDIDDNRLDYLGENKEQVCVDENAGFFPFNTPYDASVNTLNYCFGMKLEIPFELPEGGMLNGKPIVFEFTGDDDLWIFIDGYLALDLGGCHMFARGRINLNENKSIINHAVNRNLLVSRKGFIINSIDQVFSVNELINLGITGISTPQQAILSNYETQFSEGLVKSLNNNSKHMMTIFFMERAKGSSNFVSKFNLPVISMEEYLVGELGRPRGFYSYNYDQVPARMSDDIEFIIEDEDDKNVVFVPSRSEDVKETEMYIPTEYFTLKEEGTSGNISATTINNAITKVTLDEKYNDYVQANGDKKVYVIKTNKKYRLCVKDNYFIDMYRKGRKNIYLHGDVLGNRTNVEARIINRSAYKLD